MPNPKVDTSKFEYKDMFGRDIKPGDYIVYAALADRSGVLRAGQVIELTATKAETYRDPEPKIRAKSWNNFRGEDFKWEDGKRIDLPRKSGRQKDVTLGFLDRIVVVPESVVSKMIKEHLAGPICDYWGPRSSNRGR